MSVSGESLWERLFPGKRRRLECVDWGSELKAFVHLKPLFEACVFRLFSQLWESLAETHTPLHWLWGFLNTEGLGCLKETETLGYRECQKELKTNKQMQCVSLLIKWRPPLLCCQTALLHTSNSTVQSKRRNFQFFKVCLITLPEVELNSGSLGHIWLVPVMLDIQSWSRGRKWASFDVSFISITGRHKHCRYNTGLRNWQRFTFIRFGLILVY